MIVAKPTVWAKKPGSSAFLPPTWERSEHAIEGRIHSLESLGLVDGPGIRAVVFLQGCHLRCKYCHNPDTWTLVGGEAMTPAALVKQLERFRPYYARSGGGVTFSGGEPLGQPAFLAEALRLCQEAGIHTCLDTAGVGDGNYGEILRHTDLVLYDVKHHTPQGYQEITGQPMAETLRFVEAVREAGVPMWVRHVVVPGLTDGQEHLRGLAGYIRTLPRVQRVELLGYHLLGVDKYRAMGLPYSLAGVPALSEERLRACQQFMDECMRGELCK